MILRLALFFFLLAILRIEVKSTGRTKRQFSFSFGGLPNIGIGGRPGGEQNNNGGDRQDNNNNPFNNFLGQAIGGIFNQFVRPNQNRPNNNNQGNNNQGGNNQGGNNQGGNNQGGNNQGGNNQGGNNQGGNNPGGNPGGVLGNINIGGIPIQVTSQNGGIGVSLANLNCNQNNGGCEQSCRMVRNRPRCFCQNGFFLRQDGRTCEDINECQQGNNGGCAEICNNSFGSFTCSCRQGTLQGDGRTCSGGQQAGSCNFNNGGCQQLCIQAGFQAQCGCVPGFSLGRDGRTCLQVDLCVENNGGCEEICNSAGGNRVCSCAPGKQLRNDGVRCRDINECRNNNGGCQQVCKNTPGSFSCECRNGFTLLSNGQCQANQVVTRPTQAPITRPTQAPTQQPTLGTPAPTEGCGINTKKSLITRIVGGQKADPTDWPWMAAFLQRSGNTQYCGGTLITNRHVLTAAHCMRPFSAQSIYVRLGEYDFTTSNDNSPTDFDVANIKIHERYNSNTQQNDIALVTLDRVVTFNNFIKPACLPPAGRNFAGTLGYVTGWGTIYSGGPVSNVLQEVIVPVWQQNECANAYPNKIFPGMMCAGTKTGGKDSCQGDSGGPYQVQIFPNRRWFLAGVVSWGIGCARPEKPGVYTEVSQYLDWIKSNARG